MKLNIYSINVFEYNSIYWINLFLQIINRNEELFILMLLLKFIMWERKLYITPTYISIKLYVVLNVFIWIYMYIYVCIVIIYLGGELQYRYAQEYTYDFVQSNPIDCICRVLDIIVFSTIYIFTFYLRHKFYFQIHRRTSSDITFCPWPRENNSFHGDQGLKVEKTFKKK